MKITFTISNFFPFIDVHYRTKCKDYAYLVWFGFVEEVERFSQLLSLRLELVVSESSYIYLCNLCALCTIIQDVLYSVS